MEDNYTIINWYPGHMTKAKRMMEENIKLIDLVIEVLDARIPFSSRNPDIDELAKNKLRLVLLNKADLADERVTSEWIEYFKRKEITAVPVNSKVNKSLKPVDNAINEVCKEKKERDRKRGILNRPIRAMIVGIPNVGKSTFINSFAGKACTKTGNKPGVTRGKQWIHLRKDLDMLDTPGILWPKFEDPRTGRCLAYIGSINDEILQVEELCVSLLNELKLFYPGKIKERYAIDSEEDDGVKLLEKIAISRNCILKGGETDYRKAALLILDEYRNGILGKMTIEKP